jgi:hypothetical protein
MADRSTSEPYGGKADSQQCCDVATNERVQELTWALLDGLITEEEMSALNFLLQSDESAGCEYVRCVQLHADLQSQFAEKASEAARSPSETFRVLDFQNDSSANRSSSTADSWRATFPIVFKPWVKHGSADEARIE